VYPELGSIGPLTFYSFGLMAALALVIPGLFLAQDLRQRGMDPTRAFELMLGAGIGGFVGARVYYLIEHRGEPGTGIFSGSGLVWYGGLIGGVVGVLAVSAWRRMPLGLVANLTAAPLALGYAIGRIGCQLAGDGDYGQRSDLPWAMSYPDGTVPTTHTVQPTPLYETTAMLFAFWLLWRMRGRLTRPWALFGLYCILAGVERFLVEFIRRNPEEAGGLTTAQLLSIPLVIIGAALLLRRDQPAAAEPPATAA
jgi:phosphatidylglycerol---prolipoprotein diacylglyceryl transferase